MKLHSTLPILFGFLVLLTLPLSAHAQCGGGTVIPGDSICLQPFYATSSVTATGVSDVNVEFTVGESGGATLFQMTSTSFSWNSVGSAATFPGYFLVCARRKSNHTTSANVTLCISN